MTVVAVRRGVARVKKRAYGGGPVANDTCSILVVCPCTNRRFMMVSPNFHIDFWRCVFSLVVNESKGS